MSENPRVSANLPQRPGDSKAHRGQNFRGDYRKKSRGPQRNNFNQNTYPAFDHNAQFTNQVQHAPQYTQQYHQPHYTQFPNQLATGTSFAPIQGHIPPQHVRGNNISVAPNGISEPNGDVEKTTVVQGMQPNGYAIPQTMSHVQYDYGSPVTTASTMAAGQPQYNQHPVYIQNQGYADPNQQMMYQSVPAYQHPAYIQTDPHLYGQMGQVPIYQQQAVHFPAQVSQPVYYQQYPQTYYAPVDQSQMVSQQIITAENGNMMPSPVIHIQQPAPTDANVDQQVPEENIEEPIEAPVTSNDAYPVTFGQVADPNSVTSEQLTTTETESHVPVAEEVPVAENIEIAETENIEAQIEEDEVETDKVEEVETIEEPNNHQNIEAAMIKKEEIVYELSDPIKWEMEPSVKMLSFMQEDSESDGEYDHDNVLKGIRKLSFQPNDHLNDEGERPRNEKNVTVTFDGPVNSEYKYEYKTKTPNVPKSKNDVQKVTKHEVKSPSHEATITNNNNCEEKKVQNSVNNSINASQKEKTSPEVKKEHAPKTPKQVDEPAGARESQPTQVSTQQKTEVSRPSRALTISPVGISVASKDENQKRRPALPQADSRGGSSGPRPSPKPVEATPPKQAFSWASVASKGPKQTKQNEKLKASKDHANGDTEKTPIKSNVDQAALQISSILDKPNNEIDSSGVPRGLINQANSCWVNSILQTALVCDPLYHLLCKLLKYTSNNNGDHQNTKEIARIGAEIKRLLPTCSKLAEVFDQIVVNKGGMAYEAKDVYGHISTLNPTISVGQQDAEEGLSLLLNAMHDEIVALKKAAGINTKANQAINSAGEGWQISGRSRAFAVATSATGSAFDESPISVGFRGISQSSIKLPPPHQSPPPTEEPFFTLKVEVPPPPVPGSEKAISIEECLRLTPKEETLDEYRLKTGQSVTATRKVSLASLPPFLILHMKRFQFNPRTLEVKKIDRKVTVRERITIEPYLQSPVLREQTRGGVDYELRGMVLHHGISAEGGHYTAEVKRGTKWYRIDDNRVSEIKLSEVLHADSRRTPYLLLWARL